MSYLKGQRRMLQSLTPDNVLLGYFRSKKSDCWEGGWRVKKQRNTMAKRILKEAEEQRQIKLILKQSRERTIK
jgi:hypothetical protein